MTYHEALNVVRSLSAEDRARLVQAVLDEDVDANVLALSDAWKAELDRRIADDDAHPDDGVTFEEMVAAARARHGR